MNKLYAPRTGTIEYLYFREYWPMQRIGNLLNLSRERISQILKRPGQERFRLMESKIRSSTNKTNEELAKEFGVTAKHISGIRGKTRHAIKSGNSAASIGHDGENKFKIAAENKGYSISLMPYGHPFDALINRNVHCDVKVSTRPFACKSLNNKSYKNPLWSFSIGKPQKYEEVDIFSFLISPINLWFIIPAEIIRGYGKRNTIRFVYPHSGYGPISFQQYENRWDIIDRLIDEKRPQKETRSSQKPNPRNPQIDHIAPQHI